MNWIVLITLLFFTNIAHAEFTFQDDLKVVGYIKTDGDVTVGSMESNTLTVSTTGAIGTNLTVGGTLGVTGTSTLNTTTLGATTISGATTINSTATITGNTSIGGTLTVSDITKISGDTTITGDITVYGLVTVDSYTVIADQFSCDVLRLSARATSADVTRTGPALYYDTAQSKLNFWNGTNWKEVSLI